MTLYRNAIAYRIPADVLAELSAQAPFFAQFEESLSLHKLRPCGPMEMGTRGFVAPAARPHGLLLTTGSNLYQFAVGTEEKLLPPAVVADEVQTRVKRINDNEGRSVGGRERKRIREDIYNEFMPQAFVRKSRTHAHIDMVSGYVIVDTASRGVAEDIISQVRVALGSFPVTAPYPEESPRILMTDWLARSNLPDGFGFGDECELRDPATATGAAVSIKRQDLGSEDVLEHLRAGKQVYKLGLVFNERISFVLGEDLVIRKLRMLDVATDALEDAANATDQALGEFVLVGLELRALFEAFAHVFKLDDSNKLVLRKQDAPAGMHSNAGALDPSNSSVDKEIEFSPLIDRAVAIVRRDNKASIAYIQAALKIGYNRAARLIEAMENMGVVSPQQSNGERRVLPE